MTKEEILKAFLADDLFIAQGYLKEGEAEKYKWATPANKKLIEVIKMAVEGEISNESVNIIERKINQYLNRQ